MDDKLKNNLEVTPQKSPGKDEKPKDHSLKNLGKLVKAGNKLNIPGYGDDLYRRGAIDGKMVSSVEDNSVYSSSFSASGKEVADPGIKVSRLKIREKSRDDREITDEELTDRLMSSRSLRDETLQNRLLKLNLEDSSAPKGSQSDR